jgi:acetyl esterase/lipase
MGHSAGAYNAVMLGLDPDWLRQAGGDPSQIGGVIGLAGPYDFLPITDPDVVPVFPHPGPATQPISFVGAAKPPLLLLTGDADTKVKLRNTRALAARTVAAGGQAETHIYPRIGHVGLILAVAPVFQWRAPVVHDVMTFIHDHTSSIPARSVPKPVPHAT